MKISIRAQPGGDIRLIDEIADYRLCWLEGRNGIGKTLAVRLLELGTGEQPYATMPAAWRSLRESLGPVTIIVEGLKGGTSLQLNVNPEMWPQTPEYHPTWGTAQLNGQDIQLSAVPDVLRVSRIGGDESITTRFTAAIMDDTLITRKMNDRFQQSQARLVEECLQLLGDIRHYTPDTLAELEGRQTQAAQEREVAADTFNRQKAQLDRLHLLDRLSAALNELQEAGPTLDAELAEVAQQLTILGEKRAALEEQQRTLLPMAERKDVVLDRIKRLVHQREQQATRATGAGAKARSMLERIGVGSDPNAVRAALVDAESTRSALDENRATLALPVTVASLIARLRAPLDETPDGGISRAVIANLEDRGVTARELRDGLDRRAAELASRRQRTLLEELEAELLSPCVAFSVGGAQVNKYSAPVLDCVGMRVGHRAGGAGWS